MADDYQYINSTGTIVPDTSEILTGTVAEYQTAFGADLVTTPDSPAGVLVTAEALSRTQVVNNNAAAANQINPNIAAGVFLDAIMALTGTQRRPAVRTLVQGVTLAGIAGTVVPAGSRAATAAGDQFETTIGAVIGGGGTITVDFQSVEFGPIPCPTHDLNVVVSAVLGWETVDNTTAGTLGSATQSDFQARATRNNMLGFQGISEAAAITSALYNVPGVQSLFYQENIAATTVSINGISMVAHSIYVCVNGGTNADVAAALLENKTGGAAWNGTTTVTVVEPTSGQSYDVKFSRPASIGIDIEVTSPNGDAANIKTAVLNYVAGLVDGLDAWKVGDDISPWEIAGAIIRQYPSYTINKVRIQYTAAPGWTTNPLAIAVNEIATTAAGSITVLT